MKRGGPGGSDQEEEEQPPPKRSTRFVRILTVVGYMICVSSAAVMLSLYYIFLWDPYGGDGSPSALPLVQGRHSLDLAPAADGAGHQMQHASLA
ncbi:putative transmembrane protein INAFM2 [Pollicipes pollicipes]|uniref:putative transmembrane protein INAFM2 n=1 Tax=Pollicipes pollicipes TaxID=41117 RepID=UPI0018854A4E|nr:putative transmembrane protein INAFM2 [Pollicipes pollicipes]